MSKVAAFGAVRRFCIRLPALSLLLALGPSCSGLIDGEAGPNGGFGNPAGVDPDGDGPLGPGDQGPIASQPVPTSRFVRLNHRQWENTVRDLLRLPEPLGLSSGFVAEPLLGVFDTNGALLTVSQDLSRDYQNAAEKVAERVARDPVLLAQVAPDDGSEGRAARFIESFGLRAFRRPLDAAELARATALFDKGPELIDSGDDFADGVEMVISYLLQSPHFLYRSELSDTVDGDKIRLGTYEVASRLSYALTGSMPDDELFAAAARDELLDSRGVREAASRLVDSAAASGTMENFHEQLLVMHEYETISKNNERFPAFYDGVGEDLKHGALAFVNDVVVEQRLGLEELMTAPYTFVNQSIAELYGVDAAAEGIGEAFVRVPVQPDERVGLLGQVGFLAAFGEGNVPNSILRGVFVARRLLCVDLPLPEDDIPPLPEISPNGTNRLRIEELTGGSPCSGCHTSLINPLGFGLEKLDGVGGFRTHEDNGQPIDATGSYAFDGNLTTFDGAVELAEAIATSKQAHDCYARRWVEYLYGRDVNMSLPNDKSLVQQAGKLSRQDPSVQHLLVELVATDAFLTRAPSN
jgi:hypothetical protein